MGSAIRTGFVGFCRGGFFIDLLDDFGAITGANLNGKARACLTNRNCLRNSRGKATKDNCCNCQVVNEKTLANERHTPIIRYIRFSQNAQISSKRLRSRSHVRIVLGRPNTRLADEISEEFIRYGRFRPGPPRNTKTTFGWFFHLGICYKLAIYQWSRYVQLL